MTSCPAATATGSSCEASRSSVGAGERTRRSGSRSSRSSVASGGSRLRVDRASCRQVSAASTGRNAPVTTSDQRDADDVDQHRRERGAEADRPDEDHLEHAEDAADHVGRGGALEQRQARRRRRACSRGRARAKATQRDPQVRPDPDRGERGAPEHDPEPEIGGEALPADQRESGERAEHAADARWPRSAGRRRSRSRCSRSRAVTTTRTPSAPASSVCAA